MSRIKPMDRIGRTLTGPTADVMCLKKKRFHGKNEARDYASRMSKRYPENKGTLPYKCSICLLWHLTSLTKADGHAAKRKAWKRT